MCVWHPASFAKLMPLIHPKIIKLFHKMNAEECEFVSVTCPPGGHPQCIVWVIVRAQPVAGRNLRCTTPWHSWGQYIRDTQTIVLSLDGFSLKFIRITLFFLFIIPYQACISQQLWGHWLAVFLRLRAGLVQQRTVFGKCSPYPFPESIFN